MTKHYTSAVKLILASFVLLLSHFGTYAQYCTTSLYYVGCSWSDYINSVSTTGGSTNISNLGNGCASGYAGYTNYGSSYGTLTVAQNASFALTIVNTPSYPEYYTVYLDYNADGDFYDAGETVYTASGSTPSGGTVNGGPINITVPIGATVGSTRMRIRCVYGGTAFDACYQEYYGEAEDYNVTIVAGCATTVTSNPASISSLCVPTGASFSVAATGATGYQWQESQNGGVSWANLSNGGSYSGVTTSTLGISPTAVSMSGYQYRAVAIGATCSAFSNSATLGIGTPGVVSSTPGSACIGSSGSVSVVPTTGGTVNWFAAASGGSSLGSGNTYTVPSVTATTTYYAEVTAPPSAYTYTIVPGTSNGQTGAMLDIKPLTAITLTGFDFIPSGTQTMDVSVYYKVGTLVGFETTPGAWTLLGTYTGLSAVNNVPMTLNFGTPVNLTAGQVYGFYVVRTGTTGSVRYWNGTTAFGQLWSSNADLEVYTGKGYSGTFSGTQFSPRTLGGTFRYTKGSSCTPFGRTGVTLTANTLPAITGNPGNVTICSGGSTTFAASATGTGIGYQWQVNTGSGFNNITNGGVYSGATTSSLGLSSVPATMNGYVYRCIATGSCSPAGITGSATLTVNASPAVTVQPVNTTACPLGNAAFSVTASGLGLTYQWQENNGSGFVNLTNAGVYSTVTTNTLNITGAPLTMNGYQYRCIVNGTCSPAATSNFATLSINATIPITTQPQSSQICVGTNTGFTVVAVGSGIIYQWQVNTGSGFANVTNGGVYSGATTATLGLTGAPTTMTGYIYRCVVSNACVAPFFTSNATLTVDASPAITGNPAASTTVCAGTNVSFTVGATGGGLLYQWQVNQGSGFVNIIAAPPYVGVFADILTIVSPQANLNGYQYRCHVRGNCAPAVLSGSAALTVLGVPTIVNQPAQPVICQGGNAVFTVAATGTALVYQWQENSSTGYNNISNGGIYSGATTASLTLTAPPASMTGTDYRCVISGTCAPVVTTQPQALIINTPPTITGQPANQMVCAGSNITIPMFATAQTTSPLQYQWQVNDGTGFVNVLNSAPYSGANTNILSITNASLLMNGNTYRVIVTSNCNPAATSATVKLTVNTLPAVTSNPKDVTLCPQSVATFSVVGVGTSLTYKWQVNAGSGFVNLTDNATYSGTTFADLQVLTNTTLNGYQYRCVLSGVCAPNAISTAAKLNVLNPVVITSHTITDTVCEGGTLKFGVSATGQSLKYQWQKRLSNGTYVDLVNYPPYSGVNTDSLRFTAAPDTIGGNIYRCRVYETILCGLSFYTADIPLGMNYAPATSPSKQITQPFKTVTFTVPAGGNTYQWQVNKNDGGGFVDLSNGGSYSGVNTNTLFISPVVQTMNLNLYRCVIDGVCKIPVASKDATIVVDPSLGVSSVKGKGIDLNIYPNPLEGTKLNINISKVLKGNTEVRVLDKMGKEVHRGKVDLSREQTASVELQALAAGVYTLHIVNETENIVESVRFTKQ